MRRGTYLIVFAWLLTVPVSLAHAELTLQQRYLDIYLKINDAEHLEKQGDFRARSTIFRIATINWRGFTTRTRIGNRRW